MPGQNLSFPSPRSPHVPEISSVEQLLPAARLITRRESPVSSFTLEGIGLKPGERVVFLGDSSLDPLVQESFARAIREAGGKMDIINLEGYPEVVEPVELVDAMFSRNWIPAWAWEAVNGADVFMQGVFLKLPHTPNLPLKQGKPRVIAAEWTRDLLASDYELFPGELLSAIDAKCWSALDGAREIKLTDPEGTDLTMNISPEDWQRKKKRGGGTFPGHLTLMAGGIKGVKGVLASSSLTFGGPIPYTTFKIEKGQVVHVEGGGKFGERLSQSFKEYAHLTGAGCPELGVDWLGGPAICTHPKARRSIYFEKTGGSGRMHAWAFGHRRSGVIHISVGDTIVSHDYKVIRYVDLYFPTLIADGRMVIDKGRLTALDDPGIRDVAAKYGNADRLLREDWIPAVSGVNAP